MAKKRAKPFMKNCLPAAAQLSRWKPKHHVLFLLLSSLVITSVLFLSESRTQRDPRTLPPLQLQPLNASLVYHGHRAQCRFHLCFNLSQCVFSIRDVINVHVGESREFHGPQSLSVLQPEVSQEYEELLEAIRGSRYYVSDPSQACVFIPSVDVLRQEMMDGKIMEVLLNSLPEWSDGSNFLLFNMLPQSNIYNATPAYYYGRAMIASAGLTPTSYRKGFDISIPTFNPLTRNPSITASAAHSERPYLLTVLTHGDLGGSGLHVPTRKGVWEEVLLLQTHCKNIPPQQLPRKRCGFRTSHTYTFPDVLLRSRFCLLVSGGRTGMMDFTDMMMAGCIPVTVTDTILPFSEVLDWTLASISCPKCELGGVVKKLRQLPEAMVGEWRDQVLYFYHKHFSSMAAIALTTLNILNQRVYPVSARSYDWWNRGYDVSHIAKDLDFLPPPKKEGFTAVILTYNRVQSLFKVIRNVARAPSCVRVMVIWNNVDKAPPPAGEWPVIKQQIQVIRSKENKLSNRFYPYENLTSAVFSLDDDITMLTADELEFGYRAWQEFPNRLVGFPSRVHIRMSPESSEEGGSWKYESNWLNNISLVLTGAAFYHKYFHYLYTHELAAEMRDWVDQHMNCEDIAFNFLVSNYTGLPPLKVSPRKKFVCPNCTSEESLWRDPQHYKERDECINIFARFFGGMPLKAVKFRLDPVLYKAGVSPDLQSYPDMGEL